MNLEKNKYCIEREINFHPNNAYLSNVYLPLIGHQSMSLYMFLSNDLLLSNTCESCSDLNKMLLCLSMSFDEFMKSRKILEAFGLLKTYYKKDEIKNRSMFIFKLYEPLSFSSFCSNNKYKTSLLNKVGIERYQELEFFYSPKEIKENEIIEDYSDIFKEHNSENEFYFDFDSLNEKLSKLVNTHVSLSNDVRFLIEHYFRNYNLSTNEIESSIFNSIDYSDNNFSVINETLELELSNRCEEKNRINNFKIIDIDRIENFFDAEQDSVIIKKMFSIYKNTRPEDFLSSIQKHSISNIEVSIIRKLRNEFHLSNELINIIIDFSIKKTYGKLNSNYIFKVAKTINTLNCFNCKKAYDYFLSISSRSNSKKQISNSSDENELYVNLFN